MTLNSGALEQALEVEAFIDSCRVDGQQGTAWRRTSDPESKPSHTLYHGSAGVALFYLELHRATDDPAHLARATATGDELLVYLTTEENLGAGLYQGWPGYVFVLNEIAKASGEKRFRDGSKQALQRLMDNSSELGSGIGWIEPMPFSDITGMTGDRELIDFSIGAAGAATVLLYAHRQRIDDRALGWAIQVADRLLEVSVDMPVGLNWLMMADMPFPFTAVNFAHGAAGVGFYLADLYRETENEAYLEAALEAAAYVKSKTAAFGDGELVCHTDENPDLFYLGVCHGPAGTGRLMQLLFEITEDDGWREWMHNNMRGLVATGAPETRSEGLWTNYSQCCGDAGIGDYALSLYRETGDSNYLELANKFQEQIIAVSDVADGKRSWSQAEHRTRLKFVETQTGYMQGAAGIGSFLLHLATIDELAGSKIQLPDSPFAV